MALSRPVVYTLLAATVVGALVWSRDEPEAPKKSPPRKRAVAKKDASDWDLPPPDPKLRFGTVGGMPRNVFVPLVVVERPVSAPRESKPAEELVQIPGSLASGEGGWAYTGMVEANGVRMALLENKGTKQSGYVRQGDLWKKASVVAINASCIVLADEKGVSETVFRFDPNAPTKPKVEATPSFGPGGVGPATVGPIQPGAIGTAIRPLPSRVFANGSPQP